MSAPVVDAAEVAAIAEALAAAPLATFDLEFLSADRLIAWQLYWRGENFYTANEIYEGPAPERTVFLGDKNVENLKAWIARHRGRRAFFLVERSRWGQVAGMLPPESQKSLHIVDDTNMKFVLGQADL